MNNTVYVNKGVYKYKDSEGVRFSVPAFSVSDKCSSKNACVLRICESGVGSLVGKRLIMADIELKSNFTEVSKNKELIAKKNFSTIDDKCKSLDRKVYKGDILTIVGFYTGYAVLQSEKDSISMVSGTKIRVEYKYLIDNLSTYRKVS